MLETVFLHSTSLPEALLFFIIFARLFFLKCLTKSLSVTISITEKTLSVMMVADDSCSSIKYISQYLNDYEVDTSDGFWQTFKKVF